MKNNDYPPVKDAPPTPTRSPRDPSLGDLMSRVNDVMNPEIVKPTDRLDRFAEMQVALQRVLLPVRYGRRWDDMSSMDREALAKDYVLALVDEAMEFLRCINWKSHRFTLGGFDRDRAIEELVDAGKFWLNLVLLICPDLDEFEKHWVAKSEKVVERFRDELVSVAKAVGR